MADNNNNIQSLDDWAAANGYIKKESKYKLSDVGKNVFSQMSKDQTYRESKYDESVARERLEQLKEEAKYASLTLDAKK